MSSLPSKAYIDGMRHYTVLFGEPAKAGMTRRDLQARREAVAAAAQNLDSIVTCCEQCRHLRVTTCALFDDEPPQEWRSKANDCEAWEYDQIPF